MKIIGKWPSGNSIILYFFVEKVLEKHIIYITVEYQPCRFVTLYLNMGNVFLCSLCDFCLIVI